MSLSQQHSLRNEWMSTRRRAHSDTAALHGRPFLSHLLSISLPSLPTSSQAVAPWMFLSSFLKAGKALLWAELYPIPHSWVYMFIWGLNPQDLRMWSHLEIRSSEWVQLIYGHTGWSWEGVVELAQSDCYSYKREKFRTSLVVQWLRVRLPIQGTWVQSWSRKIPHAMGQLSLCSTTTRAQQVKPLQQATWAPQLEKARVQQRRPSAAKNQ